MKSLYYILLIGCISTSFAQTSKLTIADKKYKKYSYIDAIKIYEKVAENGYRSQDMLQKLGNSYYFSGDLKNAAKWYEELIKLEEKLDSEYYFRYSQSLKAIGDYEKANKYMKIFAENSKDSRASEFLNNSNYLEEIEKNSGNYIIDITDINSEFYEFGSAYYNDQLIFSSSRTNGAIYSKVHDWTEQNFTDLYSAKIQEGNKLEGVVNFSTSINTKFNESTPIFTKDGKTMYFTRNNYINSKKGKDESKSTLIKIYKATLSNNIWGDITELPFNDDNYSSGHPALSTDEKTLYFASDMPGGFGNADIYKVSINGNTFGKPENLGPIINTEGRESFPYIAFDNTLYFASNGHLGLGGLDVFQSKFINNNFTKPENLSKPINSSNDDFGFIINNKKSGFFTSNRDGGKGFDDIYSFTICTQNIYGIITDFVTKELLPNTKVELFDSKMNKISEIYSDTDSKYSFEIDCNKQYYVRASKDEFETTEKIVEPIKNTGKTELNLDLNRNIFPLEEGTDLAKIFNISIIYFDLDKWNIRPDAAKDLQKIIEVMKEYPTMEVSIRSHTDSRQTHKYNELLSDRRANSTLDFIVKNGIKRELLTAKGYGETELINNCSDGVKCTEDEHQLNRRSEFIVTKMN